MPNSLPNPNQLVAELLAHPKRCLMPAALVAALVAAYALLRPATWEASQALIVRNEAATNDEGPGKFAHADDRKMVQETILELVRSRGVLSAALVEVGPPAGYGKPKDLWPTAEDIAGLRGCVQLSPPKGAEFGSTEIFYLKVRDRDRDRAFSLAAAVAEHLESAFQGVRDAKAQSMIDELAKAVNLAADDLRESTGRLTEMETRAAADLAELRILHDASSGESSLRRTMTEIQNELRQTNVAKSSNEELLALLEDAAGDPGVLVAAPALLLESQPALRKLRDGLTEAQLQAANLQGRMSEGHPLVRAAVESQRQIHNRLQEELAGLIRAVKAELRLNLDRVDLLEEQLATTREQLASLAAVRAAYSNQVAETLNREQLLQRAQEKLAEARTTQATANAASLIARMDVPDTGTAPIGPSRSMLVLAGIAAGLMTGLGIVFLTVPACQPAFPAQMLPAVDVRFPILNGRAKQQTLPAGPVSLKQALLRLSANGIACR